jgi:hopanoid-associated phosphorylase
VSQLGIVTGLVSETDCLIGIGRAELAAVRCAGTDASRAGALAGELAAAGCVALASFGLGGGLHGDLRSGDVILADRVIGGEGPLPTDSGWLARVRTILQPEMRLTVGGLAGVGYTVGTLEAKRHLHEKTGAVAVDIESTAVAATARQFNLPFLAVRVIADSASHGVPAWLPGVIDETGTVRLAAFCGGLLKRPKDITDIIRLAGANRRALASLRRVAVLLGCGLGFF